MAAKDQVFEHSRTHEALLWIAEMRARNPQLSPADLERKCRSEYPYGERKGWIYTAWRKAMRIEFSGVARKKDDPPPRCTQTVDMFSGQGL